MYPKIDSINSFLFGIVAIEIKVNNQERRPTFSESALDLIFLLGVSEFLPVSLHFLPIQHSISYLSVSNL